MNLKLITVQIHYGHYRGCLNKSLTLCETDLVSFFIDAVVTVIMELKGGPPLLHSRRTFW